MKYYSAIKKNEIVPFSATWMDMKYIILSEVSHTKTHIIRHCLYEESLKIIQMSYLQDRNRLTDRKET